MTIISLSQKQSTKKPDAGPPSRGDVTGRDFYLTVQALIYASELIERLPPHILASLARRVRAALIPHQEGHHP